jgi:hypothetical protein
MNGRLVTQGGKWRPRGYEGKGKDDIMVTWDSPFILVAFKTLGLFNIFHMVASSITNIKGKLQNSMFMKHKYLAR